MCGILGLSSSTRVDLCFSVHKRVKFSSNSGKVHSESLVHLLRYIRGNKNLGLRYYTKIEDAPVSDLLRQVIIKTENQLMVLYDSICQDSPYTGISTGAYMVCYQSVPIDHFTHILGSFVQSIALS